MWEGQGYDDDFGMSQKKIAAEKKVASLIKKAFESTEKTVSHQRTESNFPPEFLLTHVTYSHEDFSASVDASKSFRITLRNIFTNTDIKHYKDVYRWIKGPDLSFWPQMHNFVTWCSTGGCGIAEDMLSRKDNIGGFLRFHVAFTVRRLLYEMSCPLPNDEVFDPRDLKYNKAAAERIQNEFKAAGRDFRYTHGSNNGIGDIYATDGKKVHISWGSMKPDPEIEARNNKFPGGSYDFDKPYQRTGFIYNPLSKDAWKYFIPSRGVGLTAPGLARINRSIEAFVYCILGAQVNTRSSIVGISGSAQETRQEFLVLFESAIIENDISKSIQRYQLAVQQAKVRLDFAISPGCWLFPSNLVINTGSVPGYNNKLQRVTKDMKFGINDVNKEIHKTIPHFVSGVDCVYTTYTGEKKYGDRASPDYPGNAAWTDVIGMSVNLNYSGKKLILCSICIGTDSSANLGFRFCDGNGVLQPMRPKTNTREPAHFSVEPPSNSPENQTVWTMHMVADCHEKVKLQIRVDDKANATVNSIVDQRNNYYNHKTISTLTVISI